MDGDILGRSAEEETMINNYKNSTYPWPWRKMKMNEWWSLSWRPRGLLKIQSAGVYRRRFFRVNYGQPPSGMGFLQKFPYDFRNYKNSSLWSFFFFRNMVIYEG